MAQIKLAKGLKQYLRAFLLGLVALTMTPLLIGWVKNIAVVSGIVAIPTFGPALVAGIVIFVADLIIERLPFMQ